MSEDHSLSVLLSQKIKNFEIIRCSKGKCIPINVNIVREIPLTISLNGQELITLLCSGGIYEALTVGFLKSEGFIDDINQIKSLIVDVDAHKVCVFTKEGTSTRTYEKKTITSGCGKGSVFYHVMDSLQPLPNINVPVISPQEIQHLMSSMYAMSDVYKVSRGVHNSALADKERILIFQDDIGRHNAVDTLHGIALIDDLPLHDKILLTTGRITSEIILKIARMGIPILVSRNAATSMAVELATKLNITVIGLARLTSMMIYSCAQRIMMPDE